MTGRGNGGMVDSVWRMAEGTSIDDGTLIEIPAKVQFFAAISR